MIWVIIIVCIIVFVVILFNREQNKIEDKIASIGGMEVAWKGLYKSFEKIFPEVILKEIKTDKLILKGSGYNASLRATLDYEIIIQQMLETIIVSIEVKNGSNNVYYDSWRFSQNMPVITMLNTIAQKLPENLVNRGLPV